MTEENGTKIKRPKGLKKEEEIDEKLQKINAIVDMMVAFATAAAVTSYSHKRTEGLSKIINNNNKFAGSPMEISTMKIAMDITGTKSAQSIAYEAITALDVQIKSMRMNSWKKVIVDIRKHWFDTLHVDTLLLDKISCEFGRDL